MILPASTGTLHLSPNPGKSVAAMLERAKAWFGQVDVVEDVVEIRCRAEAVYRFARDERLGGAAEINALEMVRRAERRIGQLVRVGQDEGTIRTMADCQRHGRRGHEPGKIAPYDAAGVNPSSMTSLYVMASASDEGFERALVAARADRNMTRIAVIRKLKNVGSPPVAYHRNTHHINVERAIGKAGQILMGLVFDGQLDSIDVGDLSDKTVVESAIDFAEALKVLNRVARRLTASSALINQTIKEKDNGSSSDALGSAGGSAG